MVCNIDEYCNRRDSGGDLEYKTSDNVVPRLLEYHRNKEYTGILELAALSNILGTQINIFMPDRSNECLELRPREERNPKAMCLFWCIGDERTAKNYKNIELKDDQWRRVQDDVLQVQL